jgi:hypothetical protein
MISETVERYREEIVSSSLQQCLSTRGRWTHADNNLWFMGRRVEWILSFYVLCCIASSLELLQLYNFSYELMFDEK